jgi:hypothetical protein
MVFLLVYALLYFAAYLGNYFSLAGLIFAGSFAVPFSLVIFFFETNAPQNISIFSVVRMFFIGGAAAVFVTLFFLQHGAAQSDYRNERFGNRPDRRNRETADCRLVRQSDGCKIYPERAADRCRYRCRVRRF